MLKTTDFIIPFSGLKIGAHKFKFEIKNSFFKLFEFSEIKTGDIIVNVVLNKSPSLLELEFILSGSTELNCDICGDLYIQSIEGSFQQIVKFSETEDEIDESIIILKPKEHCLNITHYLYEFIHLSIPAKRTHLNKADCNQEIIKKLNELTKRNNNPQWSNLKNLNKNINGTSKA